MMDSKQNNAPVMTRITSYALLGTLTLLMVAACMKVPSISPSTAPTAVPAGSVSNGPWPQSQEECEQAGGRWQQLGIVGMGCNLPTTDGGQPCDTIHDCEGLCLSADPRTMQEGESEVQTPDSEYIQQINKSGREIEGVCSDWLSTFGCIVVVESRKYEEICID